MRRESTYSLDRKCVFRETFNDEASVRSKGFTLGTQSTIVDGSAIFNGTINSRIQIPDYLNYSFYKTTFSLRFKVKFNTLIHGSGVIGSGNWNLAIMPDQLADLNWAIAFNSFNIYSTTPIVVGVWHDVVWTKSASTITLYVDNVLIASISTGLKLTSKNTVYLGNVGGSNTLNGSISLFEIYKDALTVEEVSNIFNNSMYRDVQLDKEEQLGPELVVNGGFDSEATWEKQASWTILNGRAYYDDVNNLQYIRQNTMTWKVSTRYRISFDIISETNTFFYFLNYVGGTPIIVGALYTTGSYSFLVDTPASFTGGTNGLSIYGQTASSTPGYIDNVSIKEVLVNRTRSILDVCACSGVIKNKFSGEQYINYEVLQGLGLFSADSGWTKGAGWTISNGKIHATGQASSSYTTAGTTIIGRTYKVTYTISNYVSGIAKIACGGTGAGAERTANGTYTETIVAAGTNYFYCGGTSPYCDFSDIRIYEIIPLVVNTATSLVKDGDIIAMLFNGLTSKIDCGAYDNLIGDKTFCYWSKFYPDASTGNDFIVFRNGQLQIDENKSASCWLTSNNSTYAQSAAVLLPRAKWKLMVISRTSTGVTNFYIDGVLSGTANQSSGTPVAGTTNIGIGRRGDANSTFFNGLIDKVRIIDGILSVNEISEIFSSERTKYGV